MRWIVCLLMHESLLKPINEKGANWGYLIVNACGSGTISCCMLTAVCLLLACSLGSCYQLHPMFLYCIVAGLIYVYILAPNILKSLSSLLLPKSLIKNILIFIMLSWFPLSILLKKYLYQTFCFVWLQDFL